ncbi:MAG: in-like serine protease [Bacteroidota bacterium]|jgi:hypothetical protein|nr:in-like serine protease [Bacteroidota bacterium]
MKKILTLCCLWTTIAWSQVPISSTFYGGSIWYADYSARPNYDLINSSQWTRLKATGMTMMRFGGTNFNIGSEKPIDPVYYVDAVDHIREQGMEPMITVPLDGFSGASSDLQIMDKIHEYAAKAAEIVRLVNQSNKRNVKYWIIANEPGGNYNMYDGSGDPAIPYDASVISRYVKEFSIAMKRIDPSIKIIAPELEWSNSTLLAILFGSGPDNIKGTIPGVYNNETTSPAAGLQYLDYISVHTYSGFSPVLTSRSAFITEGASVQNSYTSFYTTYLSGTPIKLMVDEFSVDHTTTVSSSQISNLTHIQDVSKGNANSFISGQLLAEKMTGMMAATDGSGNPLVTTCNVWATEEGMRAFGILHSATAYPKSTYWHYWMLAKHFQGTFFNNTNATPSGVRAYACKTANYTAVMVVNYNDPGTSQNMTFNFSGTPQTTSGAANFAFNMSGGGNASGTGLPTSITEKSTYLLFFSCSGVYLGHYEYSEADQIDWTDAAGTNQLSNYHLRLTPRSFGSIPTNNLTVSLTNNGKCTSDNTSATATGNLVSSTAYSWSKLPSNVPLSGTSNVQSSGLLAGQYEVKFTGSGSCGVSTTAFSIHQKAPLVNAGPDKTFCPSTAITVGDATLPDATTYGITYSWNPSDVTSSTSFADGTVNPSASVYQMEATDGTCVAEDFATFTQPVSTSADVFIRDSKEDIGAEPNFQTSSTLGMFWLSNDVWNRQTGDNLLFHQNPEFKNSCAAGSPPTGATNTMYVRLTNRSCVSVTGNLDVYWSKAGTGLQWPADWIAGGSCSAYVSGCTAQCSDHLFATSSTSETKANITVNPNSEMIVPVPWCPPNPANYNCPPNFPAADQGHFCVLAHWNGTSADALPTFGSQPVWATSYLYNNVAWKNMQIVNEDLMNIHPGPTGGIIVRNIDEKSNFIKLNFIPRKDNVEETILDYSHICIHVSKGLMKRWYEGGRRGEGIVALNDSVLEIKSEKAYMDNIFLRYREEEGLAIQLIPYKQMVHTGNEYFDFDVVQYNALDYSEKSIPMGGERYQIKKHYNPIKECYTTSAVLNGTISGVKEYKKDSLLITGNVVIPAGAKLQLTDLTVMIAENATIRVLAGGSLALNHANLISACKGKKWGGIFIKGNPSIQLPISIIKSTIADAGNPLFIEKANNALIVGTAFIGDGTGIAISLDKAKDFEIYENTFNTFDTGIQTYKSDMANVKSVIEKNIFENVRVALFFDDDKHQKLDVKCNRFIYAEYAILSDKTTLKDQGTLYEGAGNEFQSASVLPNNKLKHTNGNSAKYYYDPANPITSGMNVTILSSTLDRTCYAYTFDTTSTGNSARMMNQTEEAQTITEAISSSKLNIYAVPNPNSGFAAIYFNLGEGNLGDLIVTDIYGKVVDRIRINSGSNKVDVDYSQYANGVYLLSLTNSNGENVNKKMIIAK